MSFIHLFPFLSTHISSKWCGIQFCSPTAILVGRLGLVTQAAIHNYLKIMEVAFPKEVVPQERRIDDIKKCVERLLGHMGLAPNVKMLDKDDVAGKCKV